jgi:hypothetical protein
MKLIGAVVKPFTLDGGMTRLMSCGLRVASFSGRVIRVLLVVLAAAWLLGISTSDHFNHLNSRVHGLHVGSTSAPGEHMSVPGVLRQPLVGTGMRGHRGARAVAATSGRMTRQALCVSVKSLTPTFRGRSLRPDRPSGQTTKIALGRATRKLGSTRRQIDDSMAQWRRENVAA